MYTFLHKAVYVRTCVCDECARERVCDFFCFSTFWLPLSLSIYLSLPACIVYFLIAYTVCVCVSKIRATYIEKQY